MNDERLTLIAEILKSMSIGQSEPKAEIEPPQLPKMRTIPEAVKEVQAQDPDTALTVSALRRAVKRGEIPCVEVSTRRLVSMAEVYAFMRGRQSVPEKTNTIRKIGG